MASEKPASDATAAATTPLKVFKPDTVAGCVLGKGAFGSVVLHTHRVTRETTAVKTQERLFFGTGGKAKRVLREVRILRLLRNHPHIIALKGLRAPVAPETINDFSSLSYEMADRGRDLNTKLVAARAQLSSTGLPQPVQAKSIMYQILLGLRHMHSYGILHRDIKPENILVDDNGKACIIDFGLARSVIDKPAPLPRGGGVQSNEEEEEDADEEEELSIDKARKDFMGTQQAGSKTKHVMTRYYRAPEILVWGAQTPAMDLWSAGCCFAEMLGCEVGRNAGILCKGSGSFAMKDSPKAHEFKDGEVTFEKDQLAKIADVTGELKEEDIKELVEDANARTYVVKASRGKLKMDFSHHFPQADVQALDLLGKILEFDPRKRLSAAQALEHEYFKDFRSEEHSPESMNDAGSSSPDSYFEFEEKDLGVSKIKALLVEQFLVDSPGLERDLQMTQEFKDLKKMRQDKGAMPTRASAQLNRPKSFEPSSEEKKEKK